jgi:hypothetical protein
MKPISLRIAEELGAREQQVAQPSRCSMAERPCPVLGKTQLPHFRVGA